MGNVKFDKKYNLFFVTTNVTPMENNILCFHSSAFRCKRFTSPKFSLTYLAKFIIHSRYLELGETKQRSVDRRVEVIQKSANCTRGKERISTRYLSVELAELNKVVKNFGRQFLSHQ